jgi:hypothetical protein
MMAHLQLPRTLIFMMMCIGFAIVSTLHVAEAGLFRDREYFNIEADGFWMKGRCFMPGRVEIPDEYNFLILSPLDDFGCVVKNRRGKHRILRKKASVHMTLFWVITDDGSSLELIQVGEKTCEDSRRCRASVEGPLPTGTPVPRAWSIVGLSRRFVDRGTPPVAQEHALKCMWETHRKAAAYTMLRRALSAVERVS